MGLHWATHHDHEMVVVNGEGAITRADIENYLTAMIDVGAKAYAKLIDLDSTTSMLLDRDDLQSVAQSLLAYGQGERPGPVAIVVHSELSLDMAVLLKRRVGSRPIRIFFSLDEALAWLRSYRASDLAALSAFGTGHREESRGGFNQR